MKKKSASLKKTLDDPSAKDAKKKVDGIKENYNVGKNGKPPQTKTLNKRNSNISLAEQKNTGPKTMDPRRNS